jgi:hypothetical protein
VLLRVVYPRFYCSFTLVVGTVLPISTLGVFAVPNNPAQVSLLSPLSPLSPQKNRLLFHYRPRRGARAALQRRPADDDALFIYQRPPPQSRQRGIKIAAVIDNNGFFRD